MQNNHLILSTSYGFFLLLRTYDAAHRYEYPVDWPYNTMPAQVADDHSADRMMDNWRRAGYAAGQLPDCAAIYAGPSRFTVLLDSQHRDWMRYRILQNQAFHAQQTGALGSDITFWDVRRVGPPGACR